MESFMNNKSKQIKINFTIEEASELAEYAKMCDLSVSALCRMLIKSFHPKPVPKSEFWEILNELYDIHENIKGDNDTSTKLQKLILRLLEKELLPEKVGADGYNKSLGD